MNTFVLESEDFDFLMSEDCQMFMYEAAPKVKESFFKRAIAKIKEMLQKISDFISSATTKKQAEKIKKVVDANPQFANKKVKIEDYQETYKLGKSALKKLEKAKTKEEADKIVAQYKKKRVIKTVTISVAALATLVAGGKLFQRARTQMKELENEITSAEKKFKDASIEYVTRRDVIKYNEFRIKHNPELTRSLAWDTFKTPGKRYTQELLPSEFSQKTRDELKKVDIRLDNYRKEHEGELRELRANHEKLGLEMFALKKEYSIGIIGFMSKDLRNQVSRSFQALKGAIGKKQSTEN